jgi:hypothetical protein
MSDNGEVEVQNPAGNLDVLPKEVTAEIGSVKLFNKWSYEDVEIRDISLTYGTLCMLIEGYQTDSALAVTTSKSEPQSTSHIQLVDMPRSDSEKHNAQLSNG